MFSRIRSKAFSSFTPHYLFSSSFGKHSWVRKESIEFSDRILLKNSESTKKLFDIFLHPESHKLKSEDINEREIYLNSMLANCDDKERIKEVCSFLTGTFSKKFLTFHSAQLRFPDHFSFYWNHHLLQSFKDAVYGNKDRSEETSYILGPKNLGKSFNFALFRNFLCSDPRNRVIYIHNPEKLIDNANPFRWLLDDLQFTYAQEIKNQDPKTMEAFYTCYDSIEESLSTQIKNISKLISNINHGAIPILLIDQYNVFSKVYDRTSKDLKMARKREVVDATVWVLETVLPSYSHRTVCVASMTDEGPTKQSQEVKYFIVNDSFSDDISKIFVKDIFREENPDNEEIRIILDTTRGSAGEIQAIKDVKRERVSEKVLHYVESRHEEITADLNTFLGKIKLTSPNLSQDAVQLMEKLSIYIDTDIQLDQVPSPLLYDTRYIRIKDFTVIPSFPAVTRAMKAMFSARDETIRLMIKMYKRGNFGTFGDLYHTVMTDAFVMASTTPIEMNIKGGEDSTICRKFEFVSLKKQDFTSMKEINLEKVEYTTVFVPIVRNFKDIDLVIYLPKDKTLFIFQFKYRDGLYTEWKQLCRGEQGSNKNSKESRKTELVKRFSTQVPGIKVMFVLGFIRAEFTPETLEAKIKNELGSDIYFWHTTEIQDLKRMEEDIRKESSTKTI